MFMYRYIYCHLLWNGGARNFHLGAIAQGVGNKAPSEVCPGKGVWGRSLRAAWSNLHTWLIDFDCRNDQNLEISHNLPGLLTNLFHGTGAPEPLPSAVTIARSMYCAYAHYRNVLWCTSILLYSASNMLSNFCQITTAVGHNMHSVLSSSFWTDFQHIVSTFNALKDRSVSWLYFAIQV